MTHSTIRLWDNVFSHVATERCPAREVEPPTNSDMRLTIRHQGDGPLLQAVRSVIQDGGLIPNLHVTVDPDPEHLHDWKRRLGGIITKVAVHDDALTIFATIHTPPKTPEAIYPPRGYGIGLPGGGDSNHAIIGCWATEDEARAAIGMMRVFTLGDARPAWDTTR